MQQIKLLTAHLISFALSAVFALPFLGDILFPPHSIAADFGVTLYEYVLILSMPVAHLVSLPIVLYEGHGKSHFRVWVTIYLFIATLVVAGICYWPMVR